MSKRCNHLVFEQATGRTVLQCAAIQFQLREEEVVVGGRAWQEVQGAEPGCLLRRLMVQASVEYKKRRADSAVFFIPAAK